MSEKKILFIVDDFPPNWSPRVGYLCKYLHESGYQVYVLSTIRHDKKVYKFLVGYAKEVYFFKRTERSRYSPLNMVESLLPVRPSFGELKIIKTATKLAKENNFDIIFSSTCDILPVYTASLVSKLTDIPLVTDFRDIPESLPKISMFDRNARYWPNHIRDYIFYYLYRIYRKKVLRQSKAVTTVSDFHVSTLSPESSSVSLIYNGYDPDLFFQIEPVKLKKFTMVYTGTLGHSSVSSPNILLSLIKRLDDEGVITPSSFECTFYSGMPKESDILDKICTMNIRGYFKFKEWVSSDEIPKILQNASILLLLCNKSDNNGPKGIMYTKFFEYLAVNRPILCAPSDESTIESIIKNTDAGCSAKSEEEAYSFVKKQYQLWVKNGITIGHAKMSIIESFSRRTQAKAFINIFERFKK